MKKTEVTVLIGNETYCYRFPLDKETFLEYWHNHLPAVGYFTGKDDSGNEIIINPTNCGVIEITEV